MLISKLYIMSTQNAQAQKGKNEKVGTITKATTGGKKAPATPEAKTSKPNEVVSMFKNFAPSAEERIQNAKNFSILTDKFKHLKEKKQDLDQFKLASDGTKEKIILKNSQGYELEVTNSVVIDRTVKLLTDTLNGLLNDTQKEVEEFII